MNNEQRAKWGEYKAKHKGQLWEAFVEDYKNKQREDYSRKYQAEDRKIRIEEFKSKELLDYCKFNIVLAGLPCILLITVGYFNEAMFAELSRGIVFSLGVSLTASLLILAYRLGLEAYIHKMNLHRVYKSGDVVTIVTPEKDLDDNQGAK